MKNIKGIITKLLLIFVIFSIGFATGKEVAMRAGGGNATVEKQLIDNGVVVYFMHARFRCVTCNSMQELTTEVLNTHFADRLAEGTIVLEEVNFQDNTTLGSRYNVASSTVVVSKIVDGEEVDFKRLDEVWTKIGNSEEFKEYIEESINYFLDGDK